MSISSQLPPTPLTLGSEPMRTLAQMAGQSVEARVVGQTANGLTQVAVGRQTLALQLPTSFPPGTTLTLSVQQADGQVRVALISTQLPGGGAPASAVTQGAPPAATVQLSAAAVAGPGGSPPASGQAPQGVPPNPVPAGSPLSGASGAAPASVGPASVAASSAAGTALAASVAGRIPGRPPGPTASIPNTGTASVPADALIPGVGGNADAAGISGQATASPQRQANPYLAASSASGGGAANAAGSAGGNLLPLGQMASPTTIVQQAGAAMARPEGQMVVAAAGSASVPVGGQSAGMVRVAGPMMPQTMPPQAGSAAAAIPAAPVSPQVALSQAVQAALPRQDSVVGLTTVLAAAVGRAALPEPVLKAAQQVLGQRLQLDGGRLDGPAVQKAVQASGLFQEASLAAGRAAQAGGDLKTALLGLQRQLGQWLGNQAPVEQVGSLVPPLRGAVPRARNGEAPMPDLPHDPVETGKVLAEKTEAALSRLRLHQNASLPEPATHRQEAQWSLDLPVMVGGQQALLHLQIHGDAEGAEAERGQRGWQVRFAFHLDESGEVGSQISLRGTSAGVLLWADRPETAAALEAGKDALREDLAGAGLTAGAIVIRAGAPQPAAAGGPGAAGAGHIVDAVR